MTAPGQSHPDTRTLRGWLAVNYSIPARIVAVAGALASAWGLAVAVGDTEGERPLSWLMFLGPAVAGAFPTLELAWRGDRDLSMATVKPRWFAFPFFGALAAVIAMGATEIVMRATGALAAAQAQDKWHFWFAVDGPPAPSILFGLLGYAAGLLLAIVLFVVVLWPLQIILRPRQAIAENMMDTSQEHFRRNRLALALMPLMVIGAVVIAIALTSGNGPLALVAILIEAALVVVAMVLQRVDKQRRTTAGVAAGVELDRDR